jgi:alpha-beta hydrolase superfamily lysophospholipase
MGSLATLKHFDELADRLAEGGAAKVLTFDYRGIGRSTASPRTRLRGQSSNELALQVRARP